MVSSIISLKSNQPVESGAKCCKAIKSNNNSNCSNKLKILNKFIGSIRVKVV